MERIRLRKPCREVRSARHRVMATMDAIITHEWRSPGWNIITIVAVAAVYVRHKSSGAQSNILMTNGI
jgi:hypothetical protein